MKRLRRFDWIVDMINEHQFKIGAEIGAALGQTTEQLLHRCRSLKSLIVVDLWLRVPGSYTFDRTDMEAVFREKFEQDSRVKIHKGISWQVSKVVADGSLDFVFIDAGHDYDSVSKDLQSWTPKVRKGGVICGHDINIKDVRKAAVEKFGNLRLKHIGIDNMWFVNV